jgi:hypothetical protein
MPAKALVPVEALAGRSLMAVRPTRTAKYRTTSDVGLSTGRSQNR